MNRLLPAIICLVIAIPAGTTFAIHAHQCSKKCVKCPKCDGCCKLEVSEEKEKKYHWTCEEEQICVPRFVFPWQNCSQTDCDSKHCAKKKCGCGKKSCTGSSSPECKPVSCKNVSHNGAWVRTIRKLKKNNYECPTCKYEWSVDDGKGDKCTSVSCTE